MRKTRNTCLRTPTPGKIGRMNLTISTIMIQTLSKVTKIIPALEKEIKKSRLNSVDQDNIFLIQQKMITNMEKMMMWILTDEKTKG